MRFTSLSEGEEEMMPMQRCESKHGDTFYLFVCVCVCETNVCLREKVQSVLCWRMSVKKEPGSSLDQPFRGKRTHAVFLFGRG